MLIVLTTDLCLMEWPEREVPPVAGDTVQTDQGQKTVLRSMDDYRERGLPPWIDAQRVRLKGGRITSSKKFRTA